jgi:hypothetical protein
MKLLRDNIVGIVDAYGAVHSQNTGDEIGFHEDFWPGQTHCQWRWDHRGSIHALVAESRPNVEQFDAIQRHLTRRYGLKWWENGHHDIDDLQRRFK